MEEVEETVKGQEVLVEVEEMEELAQGSSPLGGRKPSTPTWDCSQGTCTFHL